MVIPNPTTGPESVPNALAYMMLLVWPVVMIVLFRRMPPARAFVWSILGGYLFLPPVASFDPPMIPELDKMSIPALTAWLIVTLGLGQRVALLPASVTGRVLVVLFLLAPFATAFGNPDPVYAGGGRVLPGISLYDALSSVIRQGFVLMTFAMARHLLATSDDLREALRALVVAGLIYSVPMLLEVRLSPQLNIWIYGFFQHSFDQMMRGGGFRPIVFLQHGLWVAMFALMALMAAVAAARDAGKGARARMWAVALYLGVVLVLCKSLGATLLAAAFLPVLMLAGRRTILRVAAIVVVAALAYPLLRYADLVPVDEVLRLARAISAERADSLQFRLDNEALLLERAFERLWFGWGPYERNLLHDPVTGEAAVISDGEWVIVLGISGLVGYVAEFGLLALPVLLLWWRMPQAGYPVATCALVLMLAVNMVDLMPNATLTPITWMLVGALLGHAERQSAVVVRERSGRAGRLRATPVRRTIL